MDAWLKLREKFKRNDKMTKAALSATMGAAVMRRLIVAGVLKEFPGDIVQLIRPNIVQENFISSDVGQFENQANTTESLIRQTKAAREAAQRKMIEDTLELLDDQHLGIANKAIELAKWEGNLHDGHLHVPKMTRAGVTPDELSMVMSSFGIKYDKLTKNYRLPRYMRTMNIKGR